MKVVKKGNGAVGWSKELTCTGAGNEGRGCGAVLLVEEDDVYSTQGGVKDETYYYTTFVCTECGVATDFRDPLFRGTSAGGNEAMWKKQAEVRKRLKSEQQKIKAGST